jgi:hypothetical protein
VFHTELGIVEHFNGDIERFIQYGGSGAVRTRTILQLEPDLTLGAVRYDEAALRERSGDSTGTVGRGTVSRSLGRVSSSLDAMAQTVRKGVNKADRISEQVEAELKTLRTLTEYPKTRTPGHKIQIATQYNRVRVLVVELGQASPADALFRELAALPDEARNQRLSAKSEAGTGPA